MESPSETPHVSDEVTPHKEDTHNLQEPANFAHNIDEAPPHNVSKSHHASAQQDKADGIEVTAKPEIGGIPAAASHPEPTPENHAFDDPPPQSHDHPENGDNVQHGPCDHQSRQVDVESPADHWGLDNTENGWDEEDRRKPSHQNGDHAQQGVSQLFEGSDTHDPFLFAQAPEMTQEESVVHSMQDPEGNREAEPEPDELQQRNPFADVEGGGLFGEDNIDTDQRPDPESQTYTLLPDEDIPVNGSLNHNHPEFPEESSAEPFHDIFAASSTQHNSGFVSAFSQIQSHPSDTETSLEIVAQEIIEFSAPEQIERQVASESAQQNRPARELWSSFDAGEEILDLGKVEDERSSDPPLPESQENPFGEEVEGSGFDITGLTGPKDPMEEQDLLDDDSFAELLPSVHMVSSSEVKGTSVDPAPVSSLFGETPDATNLFNEPGDFSIVPVTEEVVKETSPMDMKDVSQDAANLADVPESDELLDDLDFIDDSEFMAAFGVPSTSQTGPSHPQPATQPVPQRNGSRPTSSNRYVPPQPAALPMQSQYTPKETHASPPQSRYAPPQPYIPAAQPQPYIPPSNQSSLATPLQSTSPPSQPSSRYAPPSAPKPTGTAPKLTSPQVAPTQPTWTQQSQSVRTPPRPTSQQTLPKRMSSSFVTAKGAYSSPYDLPMDIASKPPKRHIPPPVSTQIHTGPQPPTDNRPAPLSADFRSSMSGPTGPPPRAASAQPRFPAIQQQAAFLPSSQNQELPPSKYAPAKVSSPPLRSPRIGQQRQVSQPVYQGRREFSPPPQQQYSAAGATAGPWPIGSPSVPAVQPASMYGPGALSSPPAQTVPPSSIYGPGHVGSPPGHSALPPAGVYGTRRAMSPLIQQDPGEIPGQHKRLSSQIPPETTSPPISGPSGSNRYAPGSRAAPPRSISAQPPNQPSWRSVPARMTSPQDQSLGAPVQAPFPTQQFPVQGTPTSVHGPTSSQTYPSQPIQSKQSLPPPQPQTHHAAYQEPPSFQPPHDHYYPPFHSTHDPQNQHADLPPHFEMESGEYDQSFDDPGGLIPPPPAQPITQFDDRNVMKTPEPIDPQAGDAFDEISPPRPWERAIQQPAFSPPARGYSPYERQNSYPPASQQQHIPPSSQELQGNVTAQVTRSSASITSSSRNDIPDKSAPYPSRKLPAHIRAMTAPRTHEEDFQYRRGGHPLVVFGFGGRMITMIPRTPHRVYVGGVVPKAIPGLLTFSSVRNVVEPPALAHQFPGPLFVANKPIKGKAKDIGKWLDDNLVLLEGMRDSLGLDEKDILRIEDRKVLLKLLKLLVEHNGVLDGSPEVEKAVRELLLPQAVTEAVKDGSDSFGVTASALATSTPHTTVADPNALATYNLTIDFLRSMRQVLMQGDRQNAIRKAVDAKMWGHALIIASSVSQTVWKETVEQFIRSELRETGAAKDFDSLRFLYGVLGGQGTGAVTELLPPINRMVTGVRANTAAQPPRFGSWKESLGMVIQNQGTMDHSPAIIGLGTSLVSEGRVEAGHACFLLTKLTAKFSAIDMPDTCYSLVGADHKYGQESHVGIPQVLLSEIFEYSQSKFAPDGLQHLLPYKLWLARSLTDYGYSDIAEKYCESIGATLQKEKRGSIFITPTLIAVLRELTERIAESSQTSFTEKSSWFGKKTSRGEYIWKALESNLTKFVAGEEVTEETETDANRNKSIDVLDQRFGRISSDANLNKMVSMPNLRAQMSTPVYGQFPPENRRTSARYTTHAADRYGPGGPVTAPQDYDAVRPGSMPTSGIATPDLPAGEYSPHMQQTTMMASTYAPPSSYVPPSGSALPSSYAPHAPPTPIPTAPEVPEVIHEETGEKKAETPVEKEEDKSEKDRDKKDAGKPQGSGWFGGWFRRPPSESPPDAGTPGKPIKAKLGEESAFYYDKDLKKWVNKKAPETATKPAAPPPPPKRLASKAPSSPSTPAPIPPSSSTSSLPPQPTPVASSVPSLRSEPPTKDASLPSSRAFPAIKAPSQSADPLEALLAGRPASGARGVKKPARSRYVDVMNKK